VIAGHGGKLIMRKTIFVAFVLAFVVVPASADFMTNGGAETGDLTGWTVDISGATSGNTDMIEAVTSQPQSTGTVLPYAGDYFFTFANSSTRTSADRTGGIPRTISMSQTGTSGLGSAVLTLDGWVQTESYQGLNDDGEAVLTLYGDAAETSIVDTVSTGLLSSHGAWSLFSVSLANPGGVDHWKVTLLGTVNSTTYANTFYDDVSLVPIPGAVLLGMLGLSVVGVKLRKRA